jgi:hypothetical protein
MSGSKIGSSRSLAKQGVLPEPEKKRSLEHFGGGGARKRGSVRLRLTLCQPCPRVPTAQQREEGGSQGSAQVAGGARPGPGEGGRRRGPERMAGEGQRRPVALAEALGRGGVEAAGSAGRSTRSGWGRGRVRRVRASGRGGAVATAALSLSLSRQNLAAAAA